MAYVPLSLSCSNDKVAEVISIATENYLKQVHFLLAATTGNSPGSHFGLSATIMTLLTIAAASGIWHFDPTTNKNKISDRKAFLNCVSSFFPWEHVGINDDQHQSQRDREEAASIALYEVLRNPFIHCGDIVGKKSRNSAKQAH